MFVTLLFCAIFWASINASDPLHGYTPYVGDPQLVERWLAIVLISQDANGPFMFAGVSTIISSTVVITAAQTALRGTKGLKNNFVAIKLHNGEVTKVYSVRIRCATDIERYGIAFLFTKAALTPVLAIPNTVNNDDYDGYLYTICTDQHVYAHKYYKFSDKRTKDLKFQEITFKGQGLLENFQKGSPIISNNSGQLELGAVVVGIAEGIYAILRVSKSDQQFREALESYPTKVPGFYDFPTMYNPENIFVKEESPKIGNAVILEYLEDDDTESADQSDSSSSMEDNEYEENGTHNLVRIDVKLPDEVKFCWAGTGFLISNMRTITAANLVMKGFYALYGNEDINIVKNDEIYPVVRIIVTGILSSGVAVLQTEKAFKCNVNLQVGALTHPTYNKNTLYTLNAENDKYNIKTYRLASYVREKTVVQRDTKEAKQPICYSADNHSLSHTILIDSLELAETAIGSPIIGKINKVPALLGILIKVTKSALTIFPLHHFPLGTVLDTTTFTEIVKAPIETMVIIEPPLQSDISVLGTIARTLSGSIIKNLSNTAKRTSRRFSWGQGTANANDTPEESSSSNASNRLLTVNNASRSVEQDKSSKVQVTSSKSVLAKSLGVICRR